MKRQSHFVVVFVGLLLLTIAFAIGAGILSVDGGGSQQAAKTSDGLLDLTKLCAAGLVGLIVGHSPSGDRPSGTD